MTRHLVIILVLMQLGLTLAGLHINLHPAPVLHSSVVHVPTHTHIITPVHSSPVITPVHLSPVVTPVHTVHAVHAAPVVKYKVKNHYHFGK